MIKCKLLNLSLKCRQDVCENMKMEREGPAGKFEADAGDQGHCFDTDPQPKCYHYILLDEGLETPGQATDGFCNEASSAPEGGTVTEAGVTTTAGEETTAAGEETTVAGADTTVAGDTT